MKFSGKLPAAIIWGAAIGLSISLFRPVVIRIGSDGAFYAGLGLPFGWLIIGIFSFFYLRSLHLGGICGATTGVTSTIASIIFNFHSFISHNHPSYLPYIAFYLVAGIFWGAAIYSLPGIIGGWFYEKKQTKN